MIKNIKTIKNLGKYENVNDSLEFGENNLIFGFNGMGKSTLSDVFYSVANPGNEELLYERKTLPHVKDEVVDDIEVILNTDDGEVRFINNTWNQQIQDMYVFNEQYIEDYVFVSKEFDGELIQMSMGKEGVRLANKIDRNNILIREALDRINSSIVINKELFKDISDIGKSKLKITSSKKLSKIADFRLFQPSKKEEIEKVISSGVNGTKEMQKITECIELSNQIEKIDNIGLVHLKEMLKAIPKVRDSEVYSYIAQNMKRPSLQWVISGVMNQIDEESCPLCGQRIEDKEAKRVFRKIRKFITDQNKKKSEEIIQGIRKELQKIQYVKVGESIEIFNKIGKELEQQGLLLKKELQKFEKGLYWNDETEQYLNNIIGKLQTKEKNPYIKIELLEEESKTIKLLNGIFNNIAKLRELLENIKLRTQIKLGKENEILSINAKYQVSFGPLRTTVEEMITDAKNILKMMEENLELDLKLNDLFNNQKLIRINSILKELNVDFSIIVERKKYYIKLKNYVKKEYDQNRKHNTICSEGETRALAFAYFLSEIENPEIIGRSKVIIIDDPISSLDLSRKSVMSYLVADILQNQDNQVFVLTHDVSFIERIVDFCGEKIELSTFELKNIEKLFEPLNVEEYLMTDEMIYKQIIDNASIEHNNINTILALMALRPYAYVKKVREQAFDEIVEKSTYFSHTRYSYNSKKKFNLNDYSVQALRNYVKEINNKCGTYIDETCLIGDEFRFNGFDFESVVEMYKSIEMKNLMGVRKKAILLRLVLEACMFQFSAKQKFDFENIGKAYKATINGNTGERKKYCKKIKELYDMTKKFHHGAEDGSTLGLSWINPKEIEFFDHEINEIIDYIDGSCEIRQISA